MPTQVNLELLLTGNELMTGDIVDSNSAMIAHQLKEIGLQIRRKTTVADDLSLLVEQIQQIAQQADVLIINGGLGPTVDDMTAQAVALAAKVPIADNAEALAHLEKWCKKKNMRLNAPNLKQAYLPTGSVILANKRGSAVGFMVKFNGCEIYCTPGVPHELSAMFADEIKPKLIKFVSQDTFIHITRLQIFGLGESTLQKMINENIPDWPTEIELGFRAGKPLLEAKLTSKTKSAMLIKGELIHQLHTLLGNHIVGEIINQPLTMAEHVIHLLQQKQRTITLAESCTGGMIASMLTKVSGASKIFETGFVTYANQSKEKILGVSPSDLNNFGAVSKQTVLAMAQGALTISKADFVIAVSGIAGPTGGSEEKPVGTVWLAWGDNSFIQTQCFILNAPRDYFQRYVSLVALDLIRRQLIESNEIPNYILDYGVKPVEN